jgi:hypothetical protein
MKRILKTLRILTYNILIACIVCACNDTLEIQQKYSFDLITMPVQKRIKQDETVEIRCQIVKEGDYSGTKYQIRYFQPDGRGELRLDDGRMLTPNDLFQLKKDEFRLYYTSRCAESQTIDVYIEDNFGQVVQKRFSFSHEKEEKEE